MLKKHSLILLAFLLILSLSSIVAVADSSFVGFSQVTIQSPFYVSLMESAERTAKEMGVKFVYLDAGNNIGKQNNDVIDLITRGLDVLLLNPVDPEGVAPAMKRAEDNNVPVVTVDRPVEGKYEEAVFVGRKNYEMGVEAGKKAVELLGGEGNASGKIIEIQGAAGGAVMRDRRDGFHSIVEKEEGIEIIQGPYCEYVRSQAISAFQDLIQTHPDVDMVYAHNDDMALGAVQVLEQHGKIDDVYVIGIDGLMEAIKAINDGRMDATVLNDPAYLGQLAVEVALGVLKGKEYPEFVDAGTGLVTKDNAGEFYDPEKDFAEYIPED